METKTLIKMYALYQNNYPGSHDEQEHDPTKGASAGAVAEQARVTKAQDSSALIDGISKVRPDLRGYISSYTPEEYAKKGTKIYMSDDNQSGFGINPDGELISVFSNVSGRGGDLVRQAVSLGANHLDCYEKPDTKKLVRLYASFGFVETERMTWDDQYAPPGWDYEKNDNPDVVVMARP